MNRNRSMVWFFLYFLLILGGIGCKKVEMESLLGETFEIEKEYERGPIIFRLQVNQKEVTIAERIRLNLEVRAKEEYEVKLPEFGEKLEQFGIVDYSAQAPQLVEDGVVLSGRYYELEPFLSGEYKIPPLKVVFWKEGEEQKHIVESEELTIQVKSLLPEEMADLTIKEIVSPVAIPRSIKGWFYGLIAAGVAGTGGIVIFLLWRKRWKGIETVLRKAAHEIAYEELEALLADRFIENGKMKEFYLRLSNVLRHYIENRFSLRAPERTTEEFLVDLRSTSALASMHKELLKDFLQHCDLVKFAEHAPTNEEIERTFDACKRFIVETEEKETETVTAAV